MSNPLPRRADALLQQFITTHDQLSQDSVFLQRLAGNWSALYRLVQSLYGATPEWEHLLVELGELLWNRWNHRDARLRSLDDQRVMQGAWYSRNALVGMQLYVDRFAGDLSGLGDKLSYFQELGVNFLHLMPLLKTPRDHNDGGYAVSDYGQIQEHFGTMKDLRNLAEKMHREGMVLALDYVLNHTSDEHSWAQAALAGEQHYQDYYYMYPDRTIPDLYEESLPEVFPETAPGNFTWKNEINRWVMTVFHSYQWDLNYSNPRVFLEMAAILLDLANAGVDILRLDAVPYLWKRLGTTSQNLHEAHDVVRLLNACARVAAPGVAFIAEAIVQPREIARYFGEGEWAGRECELAYNASLMVLLWDALATGRAALIRRGLEDLPQAGSDTAWLNYVRCHDDIGLGYDEAHLREQGWDPAAHRDFIIRYFTGEFEGSFARGARFMYNPRNGDARISGTAASLAGVEAALELQEPSVLEMAVQRIVALYGVILSLGGIPIIYAGDELGLCNDYSYREEPHLQGDNRWMHRPWISDDHRATRTDPTRVAGMVFSRLTSMIGLRKQIPALNDSRMPDILPCESPHLLAFLRVDSTGERVLVLVNFSNEPIPIDGQLMRLAGLYDGGVDLLDQERFLPVGQLMRPYQCSWVVDHSAHAAT